MVIYGCVSIFTVSTENLNNARYVYYRFSVMAVNIETQRILKF